MSLELEYSYEQKVIDSYVKRMLEVCCTSRSTIRVNREELPVELVRSRILKLEHIVYVMECLQKNTNQVDNIKGYTLTALYNVSTTTHRRVPMTWRKAPGRLAHESRVEHMAKAAGIQ